MCLSVSCHSFRGNGAGTATPYMCVCVSTSLGTPDPFMSLQLVIPFLPVIALPKNKVGHNDGLSKKWVLFEMTAKLVYLSTGSCQLP